MWRELSTTSEASSSKVNVIQFHEHEKAASLAAEERPFSFLPVETFSVGKPILTIQH